MRLFLVILCLVMNSMVSAEQTLDYGVRLRAAAVDTDDQNARAASAKLRLNWQATWREMFSSTLELDHTSTALQNQFSDGERNNGKPQIPDVESTEINQAYLKLVLSQWQFKLGRQRIEFDNQRFIGSNGFWQNDQVFDALRFDYDFLSASTFTYAFLSNANRIFGDNAKIKLHSDDINFELNDGNRPLNLLGDHEQRSHLFNARFNEWDHNELGIYYYDIDNRDVIAVSNRTIGMNFQRQQRKGIFDLRSEIEIATQTRPFVQNAGHTFYYSLVLAIGLRSTELEFNREVLSANDDVAFVTPLASLHDFQGWVDKFTGQPSTGIVDNSYSFSWRRAPLKIDSRIHQFLSDKDGINLGREWDIDVLLKLNRKHRVLLRYADFRSSSESRESFPSEKRIFLTYSYNL